MTARFLPLSVVTRVNALCAAAQEPYFPHAPAERSAASTALFRDAKHLLEFSDVVQSPDEVAFLPSACATTRTHSVPVDPYSSAILLRAVSPATLLRLTAAREMRYFLSVSNGVLALLVSGLWQQFLTVSICCSRLHLRLGGAR